MNNLSTLVIHGVHGSPSKFLSIAFYFSWLHIPSKKGQGWNMNFRTDGEFVKECHKLSSNHQVNRSIYIWSWHFIRVIRDSTTCFFFHQVRLLEPFVNFAWNLEPLVWGLQQFAKRMTGIVYFFCEKTKMVGKIVDIDDIEKKNFTVKRVHFFLKSKPTATIISYQTK